MKGASGVSIVKTKQTVVLGYYDQSMQPGASANVVEKLADYLIEQGF